MDKEPVEERFPLVRSAREVEEVFCVREEKAKAERPGNGVMRTNSVSVALVSHWRHLRSEYISHENADDVEEDLSVDTRANEVMILGTDGLRNEQSEEGGTRNKGVWLSGPRSLGDQHVRINV